MDTGNLSSLTELAMQSGPTFFAILFVTVVTVWAYRAYKDATTPDQQRTARMILLGSFFFGLTLVVVSVVWWIWFRPKIYAFRGEIVNLHEYEILAPASDNVYLHSVPKEAIDGIPLRNERFLIVKNSPLAKGELFDLEFSKNQSARNTFHIAYDAQQNDARYSVDWDDTLHTNVLKPENEAKKSASLWFPRAYAAAGQEGAYQGKASKSQWSQSAPWSQQLPATPFDILQNPSSDVGSKIIALDSLDQMTAEALAATSKPGHEPILGTLLDLTRYSDKEVSYKATLVLKKIAVDDYVLQKINSPQRQDQEEGQKVLLKLDQPDFTRVFGQLSPAKAAAIKARAAVPGDNLVIPTASPQGDRYYVRATWDVHNQSAINCLTALFHNELINNRSMEDERKLMSRSQRLVFAYDKEWSIGMAEKIRKCGGTASFVQAGLKK